MRIKSTVIVLLLALSLLLVAYGSPAAKVLNLRSGDVVAVNSPYTIAMQSTFIPMVKKMTEGSVVVTHYPAGQLGSDSALAEGIKLGTIDLAILGTIGSQAAEAMYLPFLFKSIEHQEKFMRSPMADVIKQRIFEDSGVKVIDFAYFAPRQLTSNKKVEKAADLKGLKIRVPLLPPMVAAWKAMGASPTPIAFTELFSALQQGIVDAQENPYEIILNNSFYEVQEYVMQTDHSIPVRFFVINNDLWESLTAEQQHAISEAWRETANEIKRLYIENDAKYIEELKKKNMKFVSVDRQSMMDACKDTWKEFTPTAWGEGVYEKIQELSK